MTTKISPKLLKMKNQKILVTGYTDPDLDGTACMVAYTKFLQKDGVNAIAGVFGKPHREAMYIFENFHIQKLQPAENLIEKCESIILVDASDRTGISPRIGIDKVIEVIDHRKSNEAYMFKNAKVQIEFVGSAATLITEKYMKSGISIDKDSAILLYGAIVSNTLNFRANVTTERDKKAAKWLKNRIKLPENFVRNMFLAKSGFEEKNIREVMIQDYKGAGKGDKHSIGIFQLEVVDLEKIISEREIEIIEILKEFKEKGKHDYIFLTSLDLEKGFNIFVAFDDDTKKLLENSLRVKFDGNIARRDGLLLRKEIIPIIKSYLGQ